MEGEKVEVRYIRHAMSMFNLWDWLLSKKLSAAEMEECKEDIQTLKGIVFKFDVRLLDPHLSTKGKAQARACKLYEQLPIQWVFVSPMRRALETCDILFSGHPNAQSIRFIVHPLLRENLNNSNDLPSDLEVLMKEYIPKGYNFELFTAFPVPRLHFLYNLNQPERDELLGKLEPVKAANYVDIMLEAQKKKRTTHPQHHRKMESYTNIRARAVAFAAYLKDYIQKHGINPETVAVVGHSTFISYSQSTAFNEYNKTLIPHIPNCAFALIDLNQLQP